MPLRASSGSAEPAQPLLRRGERAQRVYVAGSTRDTKRINLVQNMVKALGWEITFDWTGPEGEIRNPRGGADFQNQAGGWAEAPEKGAQISAREIDACRTADLAIVLFPAGGGGLGCWIEMGAALAHDAQVWVVGPERDSVFWMHPNVTVFSRFVDVAARLSEELPDAA